MITSREHVIHGTERVARRNAAITASLGFRYHVHESYRRTFWGWLRRAPKITEPGVWRP